MHRFILSFIILVLFNTSFAQKAIEVKDILRTELERAGHSVHYSSNAGAEGFYLQLLNERELAKYNLLEKPEDAFYINADHNSVHIASASEAGLKNGAWWYLSHLGFRYYFPNEAWHVIPQIRTVYKPVEQTVSPSFTYRRIWYAYGTGSKKATDDYNKWFAANLQGGEELSTGHSYEGIVNRNKSEFLKHPEYFAQKTNRGTIPRDPKFDVTNEGLVQLVIADAIKQIETGIKKNGKAPGMISLDPSDGGGYSTSAASKKIGGPSEQVFYLANRVAKALKEKYPEVKIGLYAYNFHAAPPSFAIEPNITVLIATTMNRSEYRTEELIDLWRKKGVRVGLRDYYGVMAWDWDMPGQPLGSRVSYVSQLKDHHKNGIRLFNAETNIGWISRGPAHYLATRLLWDVNTDSKAVMNEFHELMFGKAAQQMKDLYNQWERYPHETPLDGDVAKWIELVREAGEMEKDAKVQERIVQVKQYLHYVVLYKKWKTKSNDQNLVNLFNYAHRLQDKGVVASYPLFRRLANSYVDGKSNMRFDDPKAVWKKNSQPVNVSETENDIENDLRLLDRGVVTIKTNYPASFPLARSAKKESGLLKFRGKHLLLVQVNDPATAALRIHVGLIKAARFKELQLRIYPYNQSLELKGLIKEIKVQPDLPLASQSLAFLSTDNYLVEIDDAGGGFQLGFSGGVRYGIVADDQRKAQTFSRNNLIFAVGENTREFTVVNEGKLTLVSPSGRTIDLQNKTGRIKVEVKNGEAGIWKMNKQVGTVALQGILPLFGDSKEFLLQQ